MKIYAAILACLALADPAVAAAEQVTLAVGTTHPSLPCSADAVFVWTAGGSAGVYACVGGAWEPVITQALQGTSVGPSIRAGANAVNEGHYSVAIGPDAENLGVGDAGHASVVIGGGFPASYGPNTVVVGYNGEAAEASVAIGSGAHAGSNLGVSKDNVNVGDDSKVIDVDQTFGATAIGRQSQAHTVSVAVGQTAIVRSLSSVGLGAGVLIGGDHMNSLAVGRAAETTSHSQAVFGSQSAPYRTFWLGQGAKPTTAPLSTKIHFTDSAGDNTPSGDVEINIGRSTGSGAAGLLWLQTAAAGAPGSALNPLVPRFLLGGLSANVASTDGARLYARIFKQSVGYTLANIPTPHEEGMQVRVVDSSTDIWGEAISGGGPYRVLAYYNGINWTVAAK